MVVSLLDLTNAFVNAPWPGPISKIISSRWGSIVVTILFIVLSSIKKFCPQLFFIGI